MVRGMYRIYAQSFFIVIALIVTSILFKPGERLPFFSRINSLIFLTAILLFLSFPLAFILHSLIEAKRIVLKIKSPKVRKVVSFFNSKISRVFSSTLGFLLVLAACIILLENVFFSLGGVLAKPAAGGTIKLLDSLVRTMVKVTLSETERRTGDRLERIESSLSGIKAYLKDEELDTFIERGAEEETRHYYGTDESGNRVELIFNLHSSDIETIGEFTYSAYQESLAEGETVFKGYVGDFKIRSKDNPQLNFKSLSIPNKTGLDVLIVWWRAGNAKRYVIFGPSGEREGQNGILKIGCLEGCQHYLFGKDEPTFLARPIEETGQTEYLIKMSEFKDSQTGELRSTGYILTVNQLGGVSTKRF